MVSKVRDALVYYGNQGLEQSKIGDHMLQYLLEPILYCLSRFKYYTIRRNLTRMEVLKTIRSRVSFFAISNLFDKVELKVDETDVIRKLQERHSFRL